jgi:hypothetical protein
VPEADLSFAKSITSPAPLPDVRGPANGLGWWLSGAILAAVMAAAGVYVWRRSRKRVAYLSPLERALAELQQIEDAETITSVQVVRLAQLLRQFFDDQLDIAATRRTTVELLDALRESKTLAENHLELVDCILSDADLVKFADETRSTDRRRLCEDCKAMLTAFTIPTARVNSIP